MIFLAFKEGSDYLDPLLTKGSISKCLDGHVPVLGRFYGYPLEGKRA